MVVLEWFLLVLFGGALAVIGLMILFIIGLVVLSMVGHWVPRLTFMLRPAHCRECNAFIDPEMAAYTVGTIGKVICVACQSRLGYCIAHGTAPGVPCIRCQKLRAKYPDEDIGHG